MLILKNGAQGTSELDGCVLAIGNFDGVHRGHQAVLEAAREAAVAAGRPAAAMVFEPHPRAFFQPDRHLFRLTPLDLKADLVSALGVDGLVVMDFDARLAAMPAEEFIADILLADIGISHVVIGYDFHFGHKRGGNPDLLRRIGPERGFAVTVIDPATARSSEQAFSSTDIRALLSEGHVRDAATRLGYWWTIRGTVVEGDRIGRTIGFPTANIDPGEADGLKYGIYVVRARMAGDRAAPAWLGVANYGIRPTFETERPRLEVFLFDFDRDIYGRTLDVEILEFVRPEAKLSGLDELKQWIARDCETARAFHARMAADGDPMRRFPLGSRFRD